MISGIILAAGESKRMGRIKQFLPWRGTTILQQVVNSATKSNLDIVLIVLGYHADEIASGLSSSRAKIAVNDHFTMGMSSSLKCGIGQAPQNSDAYMILLGDEPLVGAGIINLLIARYRSGRHGIVMPIYESRRGHPVIFGRKYRDELLALDGEVGAREVIHKHPEDTLQVMMSSENILVDIDTNEDYERASAMRDN